MAGATLIAAAAIVVRVTTAADVWVSDGRIRLPDVAEASGVDAATARTIIIAVLEDSAAPQEVRRIDVAHLIRRALPSANVVGDLSGVIRIHRPEAAAPGTAPLYSDDRQVRRGDKLTVIAAVGPVAIQRQVVALQDATARQTRVFVKSSDGEVFSAPLGTGAAK